MAKVKVKKKANHTQEERIESGIFASLRGMGASDVIAWGGLLLLIFLVPLAMSNRGAAFTPLTYDQFDVMKVFVFRGLSLVALAGWLWSFLVEGRKLRLTPVLWLVLAFLVWVTLSTVFADFTPVALFGKYRRFEGLISFVNYALLFFLLLQYVDSPSRVCALARTMFMTLAIVSGYGLLQAIGADPISWGELPFEPNRSFSTYGNPDLLGGALVVALPLSLSLALSEKDDRWRIAYWVGTLLSAACLITSFVRGSWIGAFVALAIFIVIAVIQKAPWKKVDWIFTSGTVAVSGIFVAFSLTRDNEVMNFGRRLASIFNTKSGSGFTRIEIWKSAVAAVKDRPLLGHGPDTFRLLFPKYKTLEYTQAAGYRSVADNVHNYFLQLAAGIGIVGVGLMYGIFAWVAIAAGKLVFRRPAENKRQTMLLMGGFWAACAGYLAHLFFGISVVVTSFLLWVALAALMSTSTKAYEVKVPAWGKIPAIVGIALCLVGSFFNLQFVTADNAYLHAKIAQGSGDFEAAEESALKAIARNPYNDIYRAEPGVIYTQHASSLGESNPEEARNMLIKAEEAFKDVIAFCPLEYDNYVFLANTYNSLASFDGMESASGVDYNNKAIEISLQAIEVEEYGPLARLQLARAYAMRGETAQAREQAQLALEMDPNFTDAQEFLDQLNASENGAL